MKNRAGFTILETLIVIAIIALLIAIAIPLFQKATSSRASREPKAANTVTPTNFDKEPVAEPED